VIFYLGRTDTRKVILSNEHIGYAWTNYDEAIKKLTYQNAKDILTGARIFLEANCINRY
jgi:hypothetical protein